MRSLLLLGAVLTAVILGAGVTSAHDRESRSSATPAAEVRRALDGLNRGLLELHARHQRASFESRGQRLRDLVAAAAGRQARLAALVADHPGEVIAAAFAPSTRAAMPAEVQPYLEEDVTVEGELEVLHEDRADGDRVVRWLRGDTFRVPVHFAEVDATLLSGDRVRIRALRVQEALAVGSASQVSMLAAAVPNTFGVQNTAIILVSFQDQPGVTSTGVSPARDVVFGTGASVSNFFRETSYQQTSLAGTVFGPYPIAMTSAGCDYSGIATRAEQAAAAAGVDLASYSRRVFAFPTNGCAWWGLGTIGGNPSRAWINGTFQNGVVAHEMGHNLGLYHSHALECGSSTLAASCTAVEYGDSLDTMGQATPPKHYNAAQKERLGWLGYGSSPPLTTVTQSGVYTIDAYESAGTNPKALKFRTAAGDWYYVEYRQALGFDAAAISANGNVRNGVVVHLVDNGQPDQVYLLDMTPATSSWEDPALDVNQIFTDTTSGIAIVPLSVSATGATVSITMNGGACVRNSPTLAVTPAQQQGGPGVPLVYTATVTNNDTGCGSSGFPVQFTVPAGWTAGLAAPSLTIGSGATVSTTLTVSPPISVPPGSYPAIITTMNNAAPSASAAATATYVVPASGSAGSFSDSFDRPDALDLGPRWTIVRGQLRIANGQVANGATRVLHSAVVAGLSGATQHASAKFASSTNNEGARFGIVLRYRDASNQYTCYRQTGGSSMLRIAKVVSGAETVLASVATPNPVLKSPFTLGCRIQGSTITLELNGADKLTVSDAALATGGVGFLMGVPGGSGAAAVHHANDFSATVQ